MGAELSASAFRVAAEQQGADAGGWFPATGFPQYLATLQDRSEFHIVLPLTSFGNQGCFLFALVRRKAE